MLVKQYVYVAALLITVLLSSLPLSLLVVDDLDCH